MSDIWEMEDKMSREYEKLIVVLEEAMKFAKKHEESGIPNEKDRYMNFGSIVYAYRIDVINQDEYNELCDKYFHCK